MAKNGVCIKTVWDRLGTPYRAARPGQSGLLYRPDEMFRDLQTGDVLGVEAAAYWGDNRVVVDSVDVDVLYAM